VRQAVGTAGKVLAPRGAWWQGTLRQAALWNSEFGDAGTWRREGTARRSGLVLPGGAGCCAGGNL